MMTRIQIAVVGDTFYYLPLVLTLGFWFLEIKLSRIARFKLVKMCYKKT